MLGRRRHRRYLIDDKIIGAIRHESDQIQYELVDISASGICVITTKRLPHDVELVIKLQGRNVALVSVWFKPISHDPVRYRYGLQRIEESQDIIEQFVAGGKLQEDFIANHDDDFHDNYS